MTHIYFDWRVDPFTGWGIFGQNLAKYAILHGHRITNFAAPLDISGTNPVDKDIFARFYRESYKDFKQVKVKGSLTDPQAYFFMALSGNWKDYAKRLEDSKTVKGSIPVGVIAFENITPSPEAVALMNQKLAGVICVSEINQRVLQEHGVKNTATIIQGVSTDVFSPSLVTPPLVAPPIGSSGNNPFYIFSGGKLEIRKAQDVVTKVFREILKSIPHATLVTAWHSSYGAGFVDRFNRQKALEHPFVYDSETERLDVVASLQANGISSDRVIDLGPVQNRDFAAIHRNMHCALFLSKFEGGTNLPAMETIASGVPTILSAASGHLDLLNISPSLTPLAVSQSVMPSFVDQKSGQVLTLDQVPRFKGWFFPAVSETVKMVDKIYKNYDWARSLALKSAQDLSHYSWHRQIGAMIDQADQWAQEWQQKGRQSA